MENKIQIFNYNGSDISFETGNNLMVNATEMASKFKKKPVSFTKTKYCSQFIETLCKVRNVTLGDLLIVKHGGFEEKPGTWMN